MADYTIGNLVWKVTGDTKGLDQGLKRADKTTKGFSKSVGQLGSAIASAFAVTKIFEFAKTAIKAASDFQEANSKFGVTFRDNQKEAADLRKELVSTYNLSTKAATEFLANTGDILSGFGFQSEKALELSGSVNKLAADLSSFANVPAKQASEALTKALLGEREAAKSLGIVITENDVKARLQAEGKDKLTGNALRQAKAEATLAIAYQQSTNAIGDAERTQDSFANSLRKIQNTFGDILLQLGSGLIDVFDDLVVGFGKFLKSAEGIGIVNNAIKVLTIAAVVLKGVVQIIGTLLRRLSQIGEGTFLVLQGGIEELLRRFEILRKGIQVVQEGFARLGKFVGKVFKQASDELDKLGRDQLDNIENPKLKEGLSKLKNAYVGFYGKDIPGIISDSQKEINKIFTEGVKLDLDTFQQGETAKREEVKTTTEVIAEESEKQKRTILDNYNSIVSGVTTILGSLDAAYKTSVDTQLAELDRQLQAELEAAGVSEKVTVESTRAKLKEITDALKTEADEEKLADLRQQQQETSDALAKLEIEEDFLKKKADLKYQAELFDWTQSLIQIPITTAEAAISAYNALVGIPVAGPALGAAAAIAVGSFGATQFATVAANKPQPPAFENGGIVPGTSFSGDNVTAQVNSGEMVLTRQQQRQLFDIASGKGQNKQQRLIVNLVGIRDAIIDTVIDGSKTGDLVIDARAVV